MGPKSVISYVDCGVCFESSVSDPVPLDPYLFAPWIEIRKWNLILTIYEKNLKKVKKKVECFIIFSDLLPI
jgi:hypothetical protein